MSKLSIQLLGSFHIQVDGHPVHGLDHQRLQTLLCYLILHPTTPIPRRRLAAMLWPESSDSQSLSNLRNVIYRLRNALPDSDKYLYIDNQTVQWAPNDVWQLDVTDFERGIAQVDVASDSVDVCATLIAALAIYKGSLLSDCYDDWVVEARERLHQCYHAALLRIIQLLQSRRTYHEAIPYAQRLLRDEPLQEAHYRLLMRLHALNGDRAGVTLVYHTCADLLRRELDIEPARETAALYEQLRRAEEHPAALPLAPFAAPQLVGRDNICRELQQLWQRAACGAPQMVLILGEPGIGKTRLAYELMSWAERQDVLCAESRCYVGEGVLPYAAAVSWLQSGGIRSTLPTLDPVFRMEVARLDPELVNMNLPQERLASFGEPWQRQRFFAALSRAVIGVGQPRMLLLDEIHHCDRETAEWLHYLMRTASGSQFLFIGTARPVDLPEKHPLQMLLTTLRSRDQLTTVTLGRLDRAATAALAAAAIKCELTTSAGDRIYAASEGVPLFVIELLRAGLLNEQAPALRSLTLSPALKDLLAGQIARLSPLARELAAIVALADCDLQFATLVSVANRPEELMLEALDELLGRGILVESGENRFVLSHRLFRALLLAQLSRPRQHALKNRLATARNNDSPEFPGVVTISVAPQDGVESRI